MSYLEFKDAIQQHLKRSRQGATWVELRDKLGLPYERACPEWTRRLEEDIGLVRRKGSGRALVWGLQTKAISHPPKNKTVVRLGCSAHSDSGSGGDACLCHQTTARA